MGLTLEVSIGWIHASATSDTNYPDMSRDLTNRVMELLHTAVVEAMMAGWNPMVPEQAEAFVPDEEEYE